MNKINYKTLNALKGNNKLFQIFSEKTKISIMPKDNTIWENFIIARDRLYPLEDKEENWLSVYSASFKVLEGKLSRFQISHLADKKVIRSNSDKKVYKYDIDLIKLLVESFATFSKEGYIEKIKDMQGKEVLAVFPLESKKSGKPIIESQADVVAAILKNTFMQAWGEEMTK
jgi:hypothetical protein